MTLLNETTVPTVNAPIFSDEQLLAICEFANVIACECPAHLIGLLRSVREFRSYTSDCVKTFPEDAATHQWLSQEVSHVEMMLSQIIFEFMQRENLLDEQYHVNLEALAQRSHLAALRQQKSMDLSI